LLGLSPRPNIQPKSTTWTEKELKFGIFKLNLNPFLWPKFSSYMNWNILRFRKFELFQPIIIGITLKIEFQPMESFQDSLFVGSTSLDSLFKIQFLQIWNTRIVQSKFI
jgi:hypothetical protein